MGNSQDYLAGVLGYKQNALAIVVVHSHHDSG